VSSCPPPPPPPSPSATPWRNVFLLTGAQAAFQTASIMLVTLSGLIGLALADDTSLATLPIALMVVASTATMIPASMWMQRWGRRHGFFAGTLLGMASGAVGWLAVTRHSFALFALANVLVGMYQGFAQYYRFAAAESASHEYKSRALSWVMTGGVVAAIAGPALARVTKDVWAEPFAASFLAMVLLAMLAALLLSQLRLPTLQGEQPGQPDNAQATQARPLTDIARQPVFLTALVCSAVAFAVMVMVMTATPLAMQLCGHPLSAAATVIQGHVLGMFVPSFFTGALINRFGVLAVLSMGLALLAAQVGVNISGIELPHFLAGLTLLGVGWNFMFIAATTLVMQAYRPSERAKSQAMFDFITYGLASVASFSAGGLLQAWGWRGVNLAVLPALLLAAGALCALAWRQAANKQQHASA
jgi:predicted MFS family arabinose efflux permease